jgi:hypothetical protein
MPNPPGITDITYYKLYDTGTTCMKFQRNNFNSTGANNQYVFIGMAVYLNNLPGFNFGLHSIFLQDELIEATDCPPPQSTSTTVKMLIPDYMTITNWSTNPTIL